VERIEHPEWILSAQEHLDDGKFNWEGGVDFPGYIAAKKWYPFGFCNALTHEIDGVFSNEWCATDAPESFRQNLHKQPAGWHYRNKSIEYLVNNSGFRTREWNRIDWQNSIVLFGCSNTFGVGLAEDETISSAIEQATGKYCVNLGIPAASNQLILNLCSALSERFGTPYGIVINWSSPNRFRHYNEHGYSDLGPWDAPPNPTTTIEGQNVSKLWADVFFNSTNELAMNYYTAQAARAMWAHRTNYITLSYFRETARQTRSDQWFEIDNQARDCIHPGRANSQAIANFVARKLQENG
jgi:hypothetical protein